MKVLEGSFQNVTPFFAKRDALDVAFETVLQECSASGNTAEWIARRLGKYKSSKDPHWKATVQAFVNAKRELPTLQTLSNVFFWSFANSKGDGDPVLVNASARFPKNITKSMLGFAIHSSLALEKRDVWNRKKSLERARSDGLYCMHNTLPGEETEGGFLQGYTPLPFRDLFKNPYL
ncbi:hypothetical protein CC80DRAFT_10767 [Byssothecium circinans]|uniref:Uncharacterized protein n=1 Tax=Byssothecium circinans TaxID=147558 RepID=A0A6A5UH22_9PLEO|nr:hypothetical protein CC80DRAFT_10767 [Byssothecium circinans]